MKNDYKIAIVDDNTIEYLSGESHQDCLYNYIIKNYSNDPILSKLNYRVASDQLSCFLVYFKNKAIILSNTNIGENGKIEYHKFDVIVLPNYISDDLLKNILNVKYLDAVKKTIIEKIIKTEDNYLQGEVFFEYEDENIKDRIIKISELINNNKQR